MFLRTRLAAALSTAEVSDAGPRRASTPVRPHRIAVSTFAALFALTSSACGVGSAGPSEPIARGACPVDPLPVAVSIDQWSDVVEQLGGDCVRVTTAVTSAAADPHEFEPRPSDLLALDRARLVVLNGLAYDAWATRALEVVSPSPDVVDAGSVAGRDVGTDPHLWYDLSVVEEVSRSVAGHLDRLLPGASSYLAGREARWRSAMNAYRDELTEVADAVRGRTYVATEPLFDATASELGLRDLTPEGFRRAAANGAEPTPADLAELESVLADGSVDVVVVDDRTTGAVSGAVRAAAHRSRVPVVAVTETRPTATSFLAWQARQVRAVASALGA